MRLLLILFMALCSLTLVACKSTTLEQQYKGQNDKQLFERGERSMKKGRYEEASKYFEALDTLYPFGEYSQQAQLDIIYAYYKNSDADSALAAADRYIRLYPASPDVDYAYYMKGLIDMGPPGNWLDPWVRTKPQFRDVSGLEQAYRDFQVVIDRFPNSPYAADAQKQLGYIRNILAEHELQIAKFYLKRKAYVAAGNRASRLIRDYPGTTQVIPALVIMEQSYRALGETQMANDAQQTLQKNYPNSPEAKKLQRP